MCSWLLFKEQSCGAVGSYVRASLLLLLLLLQVPAYVGLCFMTVVATTPLTCAILPQRLPIPVQWLEPDVQAELVRRAGGPVSTVYVNKGL